MAPYIYNDEDNQPMFGEDPYLKYTTYSCRAEELADLRGELDMTEDKPAHGCWDCLNYDPSRGACTIRWNNLDESYYNPDLDDREPDDYCDDHKTDDDAIYGDFFGGDEP